ncbi:MAG: tyrosine decarboxylase MfnA [Candidatus Nezhaarchaeota archaeon]|nr:tyrosine decarboxylase MfnA [Candidatus Nezhaarchaeota archaeon]MCX8141270.1 tyrosine decarboxylase MfnA [Candidatus Nezhaarchaeota archaeon]MDW8049536.1 tyrosine decarboxylase MfnA [Nitrososphaerota archaeon]
MLEIGEDPQKVLEELVRKLSVDINRFSSRALGSMCPKPPLIAKIAYFIGMDANVGDRGVWRTVAELEEEVIRGLGGLLSNPNACGAIVSCGSEANIVALWAARNLSKKREVIVPASCHVSFHKAADLLKLKLIKAPLNSDYTVDVNYIKHKVTSKTAAIVGIAGTTALGVVDPIEELSEIALKKGVYLHVDAAFGGMILPFLKELGYKVPDFDFKLDGVCSITVDPHKMGLAPIPAGGILFKDQELVEVITHETPYLAGGNVRSFTIAGSRPGGSVAAVWALMKILGKSGYREIVRRCMKLTERLVLGIEHDEALELVTKPVMNIVGVRSRFINLKVFSKAMRHLGWLLSEFPTHLRIVLMPHHTDELIDELLQDLKRAATRNLKSNFNKLDIRVKGDGAL